MGIDTTLEVLVVDDMVTMRKIVQRMLDSLGFKSVSFAQSGKEAMQIIQQKAEQGTPIQLIISDWNMPVMSGLKLLKAVREKDAYKSLPFLMLTAETESAKSQQAIEEGANAFINKPFDVNELKSALEKILSS